MVRGRPELSSFSREYTEYAGGRGSMVVVRFFKMLIMMHCIFIRGSLKINIFRVLFWEGGRGHKRVRCVRF